MYVLLAKVPYGNQQKRILLTNSASRLETNFLTGTVEYSKKVDPKPDSRYILTAGARAAG